MAVDIKFTSPSQMVVSGPEALEWRKDHRRKVDGAEFSYAFKKHRWDGYAYPGKITRSALLVLDRGYLSDLIQDLKATVSRPPAPVAVLPPTPHLNTLRDYQQNALKRIFEHRWGCVALATNAGKGAIIALAAVQVAAYVGRVLIVCDEVSVFQALQEEILKWANFEPGVVVAGVKIPPNEKIILAMIPTLSRRVADPSWADWFSTIQGLFLDEADKASSASWQKTLAAMPNTHYRIGFSGTFPPPTVPEELLIHETIGPILIEVKNITLIERGISARPTVGLYPFTHSIERAPGWRDMTGPQRRAYVYQLAVTQNDERHQALVSLLEPSDPNAIIINYIEHGLALSTVVPDSVFLSGDDHADVRNDVLDRFRKGLFQNLIVSKILDRGTNDLGLVVGLIFASAQGSNRQTLQRIGRGLRRTGGKEFLALKDVIDRGQKYLEGASRKRVELYNNEGFEIQIHNEIS